MSVDSLRAPFPYFGGKRRVAPAVWARFGAVPNYVEPFCGSAAMLLARPDNHEWWRMTETINDADGYVSNFWRAVQANPDAVAQHADWPVSENDLHARHGWLVSRSAEIVARLEGDPYWFDAQVAGWWVWGLCAWIGSGWCSGAGPWRQVDGQLVNLGDDGQGINRQLPHLGDGGKGINRKLPHLGDGGKGINRKLPHLGDDGKGTAAVWSAHVATTMVQLSDRLRRVRVCSGDWSRVLSASVTTRLGTTAVFLDPPYTQDGTHFEGAYRHEGGVAPAVRAWAIEHGDDPLFRIALCGFEGEHDMPDGWRLHRWTARGGYGTNENRHREVIWFSPHCLKVPTVTQESFDVTSLEPSYVR